MIIKVSAFAVQLVLDLVFYVSGAYKAMQLLKVKCHIFNQFASQLL